MCRWSCRHRGKKKRVECTDLKWIKKMVVTNWKSRRILLYHTKTAFLLWKSWFTEVFYLRGVKYGKGDLKILSWYLVVFCNWWFLSWSTNTTLRTPFTAMECRYSWKSTWNYPGFLIAMTFCMSDSFHSFIISYGVLVTSVMEIACGMSFTLIDLSRSSWQVLFSQPLTLCDNL